MPPLTGPVIRRRSSSPTPSSRSLVVGSKLPPAPTANPAPPSHELLRGVVRQIASNAKQVTHKPTAAERQQIADSLSRERLSQALSGVGRLPVLMPKNGDLSEAATRQAVRSGQLPHGVTGRATIDQTKHVARDPLDAFDISALPVAAINKATGAHIPSLGKVAEIAARAAVNVARSAVTDPTADLNTIRSIPRVAEAIPAAGVEAVTHPRQFVRQLVKQAPADYSRRYGDLAKGNDKAFRQRIHNEGYLAEILDALTPAGSGVKAAGELAGAAARAGHLGKDLQEFASAERPRLRVAAGERGSVPQERSTNLMRLTGQRALDAARDAKATKRAAQAQGGDRPFRGLVPEEGEIVRGLRAQRRELHKNVAADQAKVLHRVRRDQGREVVRGVEQNMASLNPQERLGLKYALQLGLPADPGVAVRELTAHRERILSNRAARGTEVLRHDELPTIDKMIASPDRYLTARVRSLADEERERAQRVAAISGSGIADEQALSRQYADQASHLGIKRRTGETDKQYAARVAHEKALFPADGESTKQFVKRMRKIGRREGIEPMSSESARDFVARVRQAADERGLVEPGYFHSRDRARGVNAARAGGTLGKAVSGSKHYTGELFATGRQENTPAALAHGIAQTIKRAHNWNGVADVWEKNTPTWGRNLPLRELEDELHRRNLDPRDWSFIDPAKFRRTAEEAEKIGDHEADPLIAGSTVHDAASAATLDLNGARAEYASTNRRLSVVPRPVADELLASLRPASLGGRLVQKVQGAQSRLILNLNPTFVPVQIVSQTPLALMALRGNVKALLDGQSFYRSLDRQSRDLVDEYIGISASHAFGYSPRFGASTDHRLAQFYDSVIDNPKVRAFKSGAGNPLNWNPWLDDKQNAFFRRAIFVNDAKRMAAKNIGQDAASITADARPVVDALKMPAGEAKNARLRELEPQFERIAAHVDDMLGNYTRYTARERAYLRSSILFYGFLRWSVQFAFYTLPIKHPLAAAMAAKLGQLHDEEVISLLSDAAASQGIGSKQAVAALLRSGAMPYVFGRVWLTKKGRLESADVARVNPLLNPLLDSLSEGPARAAFGLMSPLMQSVSDVAYGTSSFTRQPLTDASGQPLNGAGDLRYIAGQLTRSAFPARVGDKLLNPLPQADDSVPLLAPLNKQARSQTAQATQAQKLAERGSNLEVLLDNLLPIARSKRDGTLRGIAALLTQQAKKKPAKGGSIWDTVNWGGSGGKSIWDSINSSGSGSGVPNVWDNVPGFGGGKGR